MEFKHSKSELEHLRGLPMREKVKLSRERIREWYEYWQGQVYVGYSGGKDSTVLLHMVRQMYPDVPAVFSNTGLEFPEVRQFATDMPGVEVIRPEQTFVEIVREEGYPLISKAVASKIKYSRKFDMDGRVRLYLVDAPPVMHRDGTMGASMYDKRRWRPLAEEAPFKISDRCCRLMKKSPMAEYEKRTHRHAYIGTMTGEGKLRERAWLMNGCNAFDASPRISTPLAFWTDNDILEYIHALQSPISPFYGDIVQESSGFHTTGADRTGCAFCGFGAHLEKSHRYLQMAETHPKLYHYCIEGGEWVDNPEYDPAIPEYARDGFKNWNPVRLWQPSNKGLGLGFVFEFINTLYRREMIPWITDELEEAVLAGIIREVAAFHLNERA